MGDGGEEGGDEGEGELGGVPDLFGVGLCPVWSAEGDVWEFGVYGSGFWDWLRRSRGRGRRGRGGVGGLIKKRKSNLKGTITTSTLPSYQDPIQIGRDYRTVLVSTLQSVCKTC